MNRRFWVIVAMLILSGCGTEIPDLSETDWCYRFNLHNGVSISRGISLGGSQGILSDDGNLISISYIHSGFVESLYTVSTIARPPDVSGDIEITAGGDLFGATGMFSGILPADLSIVAVALENPEVGLAGTTFNLTIQSSQALILSSLEVRGTGSSPFGMNNCAQDIDGTPNPTLIPTDTATPGGTLTTTVTPTGTVSTATPLCIATSNINITVNKTPSAGVIIDTSALDNTQFPSGYLVYDNGEGWTYTFSSGVYISRIVAGFARNNVNSGVNVYINGTLVLTSNLPGIATNGAANDNYPLVIDNIGVLPGGTLRIESVGGNNTWMRHARIETTGEYCTTPTPEATPTGSATSDPTQQTQTAIAEQMTAIANARTAIAETQTAVQTPQQIYQCTYDFVSANNGGFNAVNGDASYSVAWRGINRGGQTILHISRSIPSTRIDSITAIWQVELPEARIQIISPYNLSNSETSGVHTQSMQGAAQNVTNLELRASGSAVQGKRLMLSRINITGSGTPPPGSICITYQSTSTPHPGLPTVTPRPETRTPIVMPTLNVTPTYVTATPGGPTLTPGGVTITPDGTGTAIASTSIPGASEGTGGTGSGFGLGAGIGTGYGGIFIDWLNQAMGSIFGLFGGLRDAPPEPIPGLPLCMSNPTASDWCAIIYIIEYTVLAEATPGQLIVPFVQIIAGVYQIIYLVRWVLRIARRGESVTNVG